MQLRFCTITVLLAFFSSFSFGQTGPYPADPAQFAEAISKKMKETGSDIGRDIGKALETNFTSGYLSTGQQNAVIEIANAFEQRSMRVNPHYIKFFGALNMAVLQSIGTNKVESWLNASLELLQSTKKGDNKPFESLTASALSLFEKGQFYESNSKAWGAGSADFDIKVENGEALIYFSNVDLTGTTRVDTTQILETSGYYNTASEEWHGQKGKITWQRTGLPPEDVFVTFRHYSFNVQQSDYTIDSVSFVYKPLITNPILGEVNDKLLLSKPKGGIAYPEFNSYTRAFEIKNLMENVNYKGGFRLEGTSIIGTGDPENLAELQFMSGSTVLGKIRSERFKINREVAASSSDAEMILYFGEDSIYHPGLPVKYDVPQKTLVATQGSSGQAKSKFYNSHHAMEMDVDRMVWDLKSNKVTFGQLTGGGEKAATFESADLFDRKLFDYYQGITSYNPLVMMRRYVQEFESQEMAADHFAKNLNKSLTVAQVRNLLYELVEDGFIAYDQEKEMITINQKTINYVDAYINKIDYDVIQMDSKTPAANATIDLNTREMQVDGVFDIGLSNKQFVVLFPRKKSIIIQENRNMQFDGTVWAGRLDFHGENFFLDYEKFEIRLNKLDTMLINVPTGKLDETGKPELVPLKSVFEELTGTIYIDEPDNKSGSKDNPDFSKFQNDVPSYIYYDKSSKYKGVYDRERFYFLVDPFILDSLDNFDVYGQAFEGTFTSSIFPEFREELNVRKDFSLGFHHTTPEVGYPCYSARGTYAGELDQSNQGLLGKGRLEYLAASMNSEKFIFFPDSMNADLQDVLVQKSVIDHVEFPNITNGQTYAHWEPGNNLMTVKQKDTPFDFFEGFGTLEGAIDITPSGVQGKGVFDWSEATLTSNDFEFGQFSINTDSAGLKIKSLDADKVAFNLPNVKAFADFEKQTGLMISNQSDIPVDLPYNQYQTLMGSFDWDMEGREIEFNPPEGQIYSSFLSIHPDQDSLQFLSTNAKFDLETNQIIAEGVPKISVADAWIKPGDGKVTVGADAKMGILDSAFIVVDTVNQNHHFQNAQVEILGRYNYKAKADYPFKNRSGIDQILHFQNIGVKGQRDSAKTYGVATVLESDSFRLDPVIGFKGEVRLEAGKPLLVFDGMSKIDMPVYSYEYKRPVYDTAFYSQEIIDSLNALPVPEIPVMKTNWFTAKDEVDPEDVSMVASGKIGDTRDSIYSGLHWRSDTALIYATIMGHKEFPRDETLFRVGGRVKYEESTEAYVVGDPLKISGKNKTGNILKYDANSLDITAEGRSDLGMDLRAVKLVAGGSYSKAREDTTFQMDMMLGFYFHLTKDVWKMMAEDMLAITFDRPDIDYVGSGFKNQLGNFLKSEDQYNKSVENIEKNGVYVFPKQSGGNDAKNEEVKQDFSRPGLLFSGVTLHWDPIYHVYYSTGEIGISNVNGEVVGKKVKGYIELAKRPGGKDFFTIFLDMGNREFYYFNFEENIMQIFSSNYDFNNLVPAIKASDRRFTDAEGHDYIFNLGSMDAVQFLKKRMAYYQGTTASANENFKTPTPRTPEPPAVDSTTTGKPEISPDLPDNPDVELDDTEDPSQDEMEEQKGNEPEKDKKEKPPKKKKEKKNKKDDEPLPIPTRDGG